MQQQVQSHRQCREGRNLPIDEGAVHDHGQVAAYQDEITAGDLLIILRPQILQRQILEPDRPAQQADIDEFDEMPGRCGQAGEIPDPEQQLQKSHQPDLLWIIRQIRDGGVDNISISQDPFRSRIVYR